MSVREQILGKLFFGRDPLKAFPADRFASDLPEMAVSWQAQTFPDLRLLAMSATYVASGILIRLGGIVRASGACEQVRDRLLPRKMPRCFAFLGCEPFAGWAQLSSVSRGRVSSHVAEARERYP